MREFLREQKLSLAGPAGVAAGFAEFVFEVGEALFEGGDFLTLGFDFGLLVVDFFAGVLLAQGFLWVGVILHFGFLSFALENIEFFFGAGDFLVLIFEAIAPGGFGFGGVVASRAGRVPVTPVAPSLRCGRGRVAVGVALRALRGFRTSDVVVGVDLAGLGGVLFGLARAASSVGYRVAGVLGMEGTVPCDKVQDAENKSGPGATRLDRSLIIKRH